MFSILCFFCNVFLLIWKQISPSSRHYSLISMSTISLASLACPSNKIIIRRLQSQLNLEKVFNLMVYEKVIAKPFFNESLLLKNFTNAYREEITN